MSLVKTGGLFAFKVEDERRRNKLELFRDPTILTMTKHMVTVARKISLLSRKNLEQNRALGGSFSISEGRWFSN